jgi:putative thiamine transport system substrate-binding protein
MGFTFLKQALYELIEDPKLLQAPVDPARVEALTAGLWRWYEELRPHLWRGGRQFPESGPAQRTLFVDGEIDITMSFNVSEASTSIATGLFAPSVRTFVLERGTIGNASFVAIPFNAANKEAAMVLSDFLVSPEAQAHAQDPRQLGSPTVLDLARLPAAERARFDALPRGVATLSGAELGSPLLEPHPSWATELTATWERRIQR